MYIVICTSMSIGEVYQFIASRAPTRVRVVIKAGGQAGGLAGTRAGGQATIRKSNQDETGSHI
jgi:hypothetical protein